MMLGHGTFLCEEAVKEGLLTHQSLRENLLVMRFDLDLGRGGPYGPLTV